MKKFTLLLLLCCTAFFVQAQYENLRPAEIIENVDKSVKFVQLSPFTAKGATSMVDKRSRESVSGYEFSVDKSQLKSLHNKKSKYLEIALPYEGKNLVARVAEVDLYEGNDFVYSEPGMVKTQINPGKHYRGVIKGEENTMVALSIFDNEISGLVSGIFPMEDLIIGRKRNSDNHVIYRETSKPADGLNCGTIDDGVQYSVEQIEYNGDQTALLNNCVRLYVEVDNDIYRDFGSQQRVTTFVTGFMNQVAAVYANENIKVLLRPIVIWTQQSPYYGNSTTDMMYRFQNYRRNFDGNLGMLVGYNVSGGVAAGFNGLCNSNRSYSQAYSSINNYYDTWPRFSWTVDLVSHEYGHLFGSRHTHACVWNGNGTAIDSCSGFTEGNCYLPGNPSGGGTTMSYCHQTVGKNPSKGFGPQPGNVIRYNVNNKSCLTGCDGNDPDPNPDPDPSNCFKRTMQLTIQFDQYPGETSYELRDSNGRLKYYGGPFENYNPGSTYRESITLPDNDEYTFTLYDSYGDGICCSYGSGSYSLKDSNNKTIASGARFNRSTSTEFCVGASTSDTEKPSTPANLRTTDIEMNSVDLDWSNSTDNVGVVGYDIYVNGKNLGRVTDSNTPVTNLVPDSEYTAYVIAVDAAGNESSRSNVITFTTLSDRDTISPSAPANLRTTDIQTTTVDLDWSNSTDNVGVAGYTIYVNGRNLGNESQSSTTVTNLTPNTRYTAYVVAYDAEGNVSGRSNEIRFTTLGNEDSINPTEPTNVVADSITDSSAVVRWTAATDNVGVVNYHIYLNGQKVGESSQTNFTLNGLNSDSSYEVYVIAVDAARNQSRASRSVVFRTERESQGPVTDYCVIPSKQTTVWLDYVQVSSIDNETGNDNSYADYTNQVANLVPGENDITVSSDYQNWWQSFATKYFKVWIDLNKNGEFEDNEVVLNFSTLSSAYQYRVMDIPADAPSGTTRMRVSVKQNSYANACGEAINGEVEDYTVNIVTSQMEMSPMVEVSNTVLSPNPVRLGQSMHIQMKGKSVQSTITVIDMNGKVISRRDFNGKNISLDTSDLTKGMYFIQIDNENESTTKKVIIQ